jgi:hypothetical protein
LLQKDLIPSQALCFQDSVPFLLSRLDEILGTQEPSRDSELNLVVQWEPSFLRPIKHGLTVALDFEHAVASFDQLEGHVVTVQPTLEFSHQTGSLSLEVSVGTPRNPNVECHSRNGLQVNIHH